MEPQGVAVAVRFPWVSTYIGGLKGWVGFIPTWSPGKEAFGLISYPGEGLFRRRNKDGSCAGAHDVNVGFPTAGTASHG